MNYIKLFEEINWERVGSAYLDRSELEYMMYDLTDMFKFKSGEIKQDKEILVTNSNSTGNNFYSYPIVAIQYHFHCDDPKDLEELKSESKKIFSDKLHGQYGLTYTCRFYPNIAKNVLVEVRIDKAILI